MYKLVISMNDYGPASGVCGRLWPASQTMDGYGSGSRIYVDDLQAWYNYKQLKVRYENYETMGGMYCSVPQTPGFADRVRCSR